MLYKFLFILNIIFLQLACAPVSSQSIPMEARMGESLGRVNSQTQQPASTEQALLRFYGVNSRQELYDQETYQRTRELLNGRYFNDVDSFNTACDQGFFLTQFNTQNGMTLPFLVLEKYPLANVRHVFSLCKRLGLSLRDLNINGVGILEFLQERINMLYQGLQQGRSQDSQWFVLFVRYTLLYSSFSTDLFPLWERLAEDAVSFTLWQAEATINTLTNSVRSSSPELEERLVISPSSERPDSPRLDLQD